MRTGERVVNGGPVAGFLVVGEQREIDDPQEVEFRRIVIELHHHGAFRADAAEDGADAVARSGGEEDDVALREVELVDDVCFFRVGEDLPERTLVFAVFELDEGEVFYRQPGLHRDLVEAVHLAGGDDGEALGVDGPNHAAAVENAAEDLEFGGREHVRKISDFHLKAGVRLVGAVDAHRVCVSHARETGGHIDAEAGLEHRA